MCHDSHEPYCNGNWTTCKQPLQKTIKSFSKAIQSSFYNGVMTHMSHVTMGNDIQSSCYNLYSLVCHIWMSHVPTGDERLASSLRKSPYEWVRSQMNESCQVWMGQDPCESWPMWLSHVTYERVMSQQATNHCQAAFKKGRMNKSCRKWMSHVTYEWGMPRMSHDPCEWVMPHINDSCLNRWWTTCKQPLKKTTCSGTKSFKSSSWLARRVRHRIHCNTHCITHCNTVCSTIFQVEFVASTSYETLYTATRTAARTATHIWHNLPSRVRG